MALEWLKGETCRLEDTNMKGCGHPSFRMLRQPNPHTALLCVPLMDISDGKNKGAVTSQPTRPLGVHMKKQDTKRRRNSAYRKETCNLTSLLHFNNRLKNQRPTLNSTGYRKTHTELHSENQK
jgi:hypothetical protein